jgi:NAD(P)H dehydrogenase (quinone)
MVRRVEGRADADPQDAGVFWPARSFSNRVRRGETAMFVVTGASGNVGGATARALLKAGRKVRVVLRDQAKAAPWQALGAEVAIAELSDVEALGKAFAGAEAVFLMMPPNFAPDRNYSFARKTAAELAAAVKAGKPGRVAALSSIGGGRDHGLGLITQVHILEQALGELDLPVAYLRPGWFMENSAWDVAPARDTGQMPSFLQPVDKGYPMIATRDIGEVAARVMAEEWTGRRVIEIEGPKRYSQVEIAALMAAAVGREVALQPVPRSGWEALFQSQGTADPAPRIEMIDGFNSGWIAFEPGLHEHVTGTTTFKTVLDELVAKAS